MPKLKERLREKNLPFGAREKKRDLIQRLLVGVTSCGASPAEVGQEAVMMACHFVEVNQVFQQQCGLVSFFWFSKHDPSNLNAAWNGIR